MGKQVKQLTSGAPEYDLPCAVDCEKTVLGSLLLDNDTFFNETSDLSAADFYLDAHRRIYACINDIMFGMVDGARNVDIVTLSNELARRKEIQLIGGVSYLASLTEGLPLRPVIDEYVRIVKDKARLRKLIFVFRGGLERAADQVDSPSKIMASIQEALTEVEADRNSEATRIGDITAAVEESIIASRNKNLQNMDGALDMTWGVDDLDKFTKGMFGGELTILAGESGSGKTSLLMQILLANALQGIPCALFSMEMKKEQVVRRLYAQLSDILTSRHIRDPRLMSLGDVKTMREVSQIIGKLPIWIDDTSPLTLQKLKARAKMLRYRHKIRVLAGDYLQLLEVPGERGVEKIERISFGMRDFAKSEPEMATIMLSQYSKAAGFVKKARRTKNDLMGGSAIHHAAQNVLLITVESSAKKESGEMLDAEITIDKQRDGATGRVLCCYDRAHLKFITRGEDSAKQSAIDYNSIGKNRAAGTGSERD